MISLLSSSNLCNENRSPMITKKYATNHQRSMTENISYNEENDTSMEQTSEKDVFDDDTSKLSFKEKMVLFNKNKQAEKSISNELTAKVNRSRLTQVF